MIKKVTGDSGKEYTIDTTSVTCTCPGWIYNKKRFLVGDPERMCKHLKKAFEENPESFPKVYLDAKKAEEAAENEDKSFSSTDDGMFVRSEFTPLVNTVKELFDVPENKLVTTGVYRIGNPTINKATLMCGVDSSNYGKPLMSNRNRMSMRLLGISDDYDVNHNLMKLTFVPSGMKIVEIKIVPLSELLFQRLFDTGPKESILELINRSNENGYKLSKFGFDGIPNSDFQDEKSIYDFLKLDYPYDRVRYYDI